MTQELTTDNFQHEVLESPVPVLVDFWSPNCGPCRQIAPIIEQMAAEANGRFRVGKVDVWDEPTLATRYRISAVPTLLVFMDGMVVNNIVGFQDKRKLMEALQRSLGGPVK